jgi:hypothetical protein
MAYALRGLTRLLMASKTAPLGKKTKRSARANAKKRREDDPVEATPANTASPIQKRDRHIESRGGERIKEEIPEALAYFLEVYGRLGRG